MRLEERSASERAWIGVVGFLLLTFSLSVLEFVLAREQRPAFVETRARQPSDRPLGLRNAVAAGGYRGLLHLKGQELLLWAILWLAVVGILFLGIPARDRVVTAPSIPA